MLGSPRLLLDAVRHPLQASPAVALSGLLPRGKGTLQPVHDVVAAASLQGLPGRNWPVRPSLWVVATDYDTGSRVVFGRDPIGAALADAVVASCSIPAWYSPVEISGRYYIDGGTVSNASVDLLVPLVNEGAVREVFVLAPMASEETDRPRSPMARLERVVRRAITRGIQADVERLRAAGAEVVLHTPGPLDLEVMGANLMNPRMRTRVLETALLTTAARLRAMRIEHDIAGLDDEPDSGQFGGGVIETPSKEAG
jgi:NTE family protein